MEMRAYEPLTEGAASEPAAALYRQAFEKLEEGDPGAMPAFAAMVGLRANDRLAGFHLKRLLNGGTGTRIELS